MLLVYTEPSNQHFTQGEIYEIVQRWNDEITVIDNNGYLKKSNIKYFWGDNMANKDLKNRTPIGSAINKTLYEELKNYSKETGIPISKLLDKSILLFLKSTKK